MSITGILNGYYPALSVANMQTQLTALQAQLTTGEKSTDYAGIGSNRSLAIALQTQLAAYGNYSNVMTNVSTRLTLAQQALTQIGTTTNQVQAAALNSPFVLNQSGQTPDQQTVMGQLGQVIDALNTQVGTSYLFSGTATNTPAVASTSTILNGNGAQAGFEQVMSERAQADLGTNGLGRVVIPPTSASPADVAGAGATLSPDAIASMSGIQNISALSSAGGTLVINGQPVTINPGDNAAAILGDISGQSGATGVTAALDSSNHLVLQSANASTAVAIGGASTGSLLAELGLSASTANPVNLVTQGAVTNGDQLVIGVGANPATTITFGNGPGQVSTLAGLNAALSGLAGGTASVDPTNGNISVRALNGTDSITTAFTGVGPVSNFGITTGTAAPAAGTRVSLGEDVAGSVFGLKIASVTSTLTGATVAGPTGSPANTTVDLGSNPKAGDTLTYTFNLPDGTTQQLTLTATTASPPAVNQFTIGTTPAATATNLQAALTNSVKTLAATSLTAASAVAAGNEFFATGGNPPQRVNGPPFATATSLTAGTSANTVFWYTGENGTMPARSTASAQIDPSTTVSFGMRANEPALATSVENMALFATMTFSASDPNAQARYQALTQRINTNLNIPAGSQTVTSIEGDIANTQISIKTATDNNTQTTATLQNMIQSIEGVSNYDVSAQLLSTQTSLQATLQVTALLAKTNLATMLGPLG